MAPTTKEALAREITRITTSPYPTQLRTLHDLAQQCTDSDVSQWAACSPCAIPSLAACLIEGLRQWSYVLDIVAKFAFARPFRDALLMQEPTLLHSIVSQAVKRGGKFVRASIALLSSPLPDTIALPAEVQALFVGLVEEAAKKPSAASIEPVYVLLSGTGPLLLGILSNDSLVQFEAQMLGILKGGSGTPDQNLSLYCLSIMNAVCSSTDAEFRLTASSYSTQDFLASTPSTSRWKSDAMQEFFTGHKAQRSVQLIVLLVLWASSAGSSEENMAEKIRSLVLANEVIMAIPADLRKNWCMANATTVRKLQEKLSAQGQHETARILALRFLGKLCELDALPHEVLEKIESTFLEIESVQLVQTLCPRATDTQLFLRILSNASINTLLRKSVEYSTRTVSGDIAPGLSAFTCILISAKSAIEEQKIIGHEIQSTMSDASFIQNLQQLQNVLDCPVGHHSDEKVSEGCPKTLHRLRSNLAHQISDLLLRICQSSSTSSDIISVLLNLHATSARGIGECSHERPRLRESIILGDCDSHNLTEPMDWREAVHTRFTVRASLEQDAISAIFARACASLEARCEDVERPLRKEREKRQVGEQKIKELNQVFADLENRNVDLVTQFRRVEAEREQNLQDLQLNRDQNSQLLSRINNLEQELQEMHALNKRRLAKIEEERQAQDVDSAATLAGKEAEIEDLREQLKQLVRDRASKEEEALTLRTDLASAQSDCHRLEEELSSKDDRFEQMHATLTNVQTARDELFESKCSLEQQIKATTDASGQQCHRLANLEARLRELQDEHESVKFAAHRSDKQAESDRQTLRAELSAKENSLSSVRLENNEQASQLKKLQDKLDDTSRTLELRNARVINLKSRIAQLQRQCEQKDQQISEAEAMRGNLMAAMGIANHNLPTQQLPHRSRESVIAPATTIDSQLEQVATPPTPASADVMDVGETQNAQEDGSQAPNLSSFESASPTPKRPRPRKPASSTALKTRVSMSVAPLTTGQGGKGTQIMMRRQTLGTVSGNANINGKEVVFETPKKKRNGSLTKDDTSMFDESEFFAGTQGQKMVEECENEE